MGYALLYHDYMYDVNYRVVDFGNGTLRTTELAVMVLANSARTFNTNSAWVLQKSVPVPILYHIAKEFGKWRKAKDDISDTLKGTLNSRVIL